MALALIGEIGTAGETGYAIEYAGEAAHGLSMEGRMTLCNLTVEGGARCGMVAVDDKTIDYLHGRPSAPQGAAWNEALAYWRTLKSDNDAAFDRVLTIDASGIRPAVTWGTSPEMVTTINGCVPDPAFEDDPVKREGMERALAYMGLRHSTPITGIHIDVVFIGSCINSRIKDVCTATQIVRGHKVAKNVQQALVVPGSGMVKR